MKSLEEGLLKVVLYSIKNIAKIELFPNNNNMNKTFICTFVATF